MNQNDSIFRKKSLDYISSPEQLTDYIKVSSPSVWIFLSAIFVLLAAAIIWAVFGSLPTTITVNTYVEGGSAVCYVDSDTTAKIKPGMPIRINHVDGTITRIEAQPLSAAELRVKYRSDYLEALLKAGDWNFAVESSISGISNGVYPMTIILGSVKPVWFLTN